MTSWRNRITATRQYGKLYGDPGLRHCVDIDILIAPTSLSAADAVLAQAGYLRERPAFAMQDARWAFFRWAFHHACYRKPGGPSLELHWRLQALRSFHQLHPAEALAAAERIALGSTEVPVLKLSEQLVYLAGHGARHNWFRLKWLCDIPPLLERMEPSDHRVAQQRATALGLQRPLAQALLLAQWAFGTAIPPVFGVAGQQDRRVRYLTACGQTSILQGGCPGSASRSLSDRVKGARRWLRYKRSVSYKLDYMFRLVVDVRDIEAIRLPPSLFFLYAVLRPFFWLRRRVRR